MTRVVIVGAGKGGRALLEMFAGDPTLSIVGVADVNPWAPGIELARRLGVRVTTDFRELVADPAVDLVIDVTGNAEVRAAIGRLTPPGTEVMGGVGARFMWDLLAERKKAEDLEGRYSLVVRELQAQAEGELIVGQNPKMREVAELVARVAPTQTAVLIRGEPGTGKELVARAIHRYSPLRHRPLLTLNCTPLGPAEIEAELFGHRRDASAGAAADRAGLLEKADGAAVFLDEIGDLPLGVQGKLVRVLETGDIRRVGEAVARRVRVRIIAATNRDPEAAALRGELHPELHARLASFTLALPALRERAEDLPVLAYHFLRKAAAKINRKVDRISSEALDLLKQYPWPGNLRELENVIERAVILATERTIEPRHLPLTTDQRSMAVLALADGLPTARDRLAADFERQALVRLLGETRGNVSVAARLARTTRRNFHRLLLKHAIDARRFRPTGTEASRV